MSNPCNPLPDGVLVPTDVDIYRYTEENEAPGFYVPGDLTNGMSTTYNGNTQYAIGYTRADGDWAVLAAINNNDGHLNERQLTAAIHMLRELYGEVINERIDVRNREELPDYVTWDEEE